MPVGKLGERLQIQRNNPPTISVSSLTRATTTATATTATAHNYIATDYVTFAGSDIAGWNAKFKIVTVPTPTTFTFTCNGTLTTPATGVITVVYTSNAAGGQGNNYWRELVTVWAELIPIRASERFQLAAMHSDTAYRFRVRVRVDVTTTMRCLWTPRWPTGASQQTLVITGVLPDGDGDGRSYMLIECAKVSS